VLVAVAAVLFYTQEKLFVEQLVIQWLLELVERVALLQVAQRQILEL
jgi:hypothetical protein